MIGLIKRPQLFKTGEILFTKRIKAVFKCLMIKRLSLVNPILATFRLEYEDDYEYEFSILSTEH